MNNNALYYHTVHESVALRWSIIDHIDDYENPTDLLTKVLYTGNIRYLVNSVLHNIQLQLEVI